MNRFVICAGLFVACHGENTYAGKKNVAIAADGTQSEMYDFAQSGNVDQIQLGNSQNSKRSLLQVGAQNTMKSSTRHTASISTSELEDNINDAIKISGGSYVIPEGTYVFDANEKLSFSGGDSFTLNGTGATFLFDHKGALVFKDCHDLVLDGLTIDFVPQYAQGKVVSLSGTSLVVDLDDDMLQLDHSSFSSSWTTRVGFWNATDRKLLRNYENTKPVNIYAPSFSKTSGGASGTQRWNVQLTLNPDNSIDYPVDSTTLVTISPNSGNAALLLSNVGDSRFKNLNIYSSSGRGIVEMQSIGSNQYNYITIARRDYGDYERLLGVNGDGFHSTANTDGPIFRYSEVAYTGGDSVNVLAPHFLVYSTSDTSLVVIDRVGFMLDVPTDTVLSFYSLSDYSSAGTCTISSLSSYTLSSSAIQSFRDGLATKGYAFNDWVFRKTAGVQIVCSGTIPSGDYVAFPEGRGNVDLKFRKNKIHDSYSRCVMVRTKGVIFNQNFLKRCGGVHVDVDRTMLAGDPGMDVTFKNNKFKQNSDNPIVIDNQAEGTVTETGTEIVLY